MELLEVPKNNMSAMLQDSPDVLRAYEEYKRFTADPVMREKVKAHERFLINQKLDRAEAREEGRTEKARETAAIMKKEGFDTAVIARMTSLPLSEIETILQK